MLADTNYFGLFCMIAGILILCFWLPRRLRMKRNKDRESRTDPSNSHPHIELQRKMESMMVDLLEMSQELTARLDTKIAVLEELVNQADRSIEALGNQVQSKSLTQVSGEAGPERVESREEKLAKKYGDIYALHKEGHGPSAIAEQTQRPIGEVQLILGLIRKELDVDSNIDNEAEDNDLRQSA